MAYAMNAVDWYRRNRSGLVGFGGFNGFGDFGAFGGNSIAGAENIADNTAWSAQSCIVSNDGRFAACLSGGNFYIHKHADPALAIVKVIGGGGQGHYLRFNNGNLVLEKSPGYGVVWSSGGSAGARLVMQDDGNLVVYKADGAPSWSSGTNGVSAPYPQSATPAPAQQQQAPPPSQPAGPSAADVYNAALPDATRAQQAGLAPNRAPAAYTAAVEAVTLYKGPMLDRAKAGDVSGVTSDAARIRQLADSAEAANRSYVQPLPAGWVKLADEYGTVSMPPTAPGPWPVQYGANGKFIAKTVVGSAPCGNDYFSDPIFGVVKACYFDASTAAAVDAAQRATSEAMPLPGPQLPYPTPQVTPVYQPGPTTVLVAQPVTPASSGPSNVILYGGLALAALLLFKK
jgi:hypothetical protein